MGRQNGRGKIRPDKGMKRVFQWVFFALLLFASGCSSYSSAWNEAGAAKSVTSGLEGRWSGSWLSHHNGHRGALRCIMRPTGEAGQVEAWFDSRYAKILQFKMKTTFDAKPVPGAVGTWTFSGTENLGRLFGEYTWTGAVRGDAFESTYRSKHDHGIFTMNRVR